ncbi:MAG: hypothetical protein KJ737_16620 [Proteobacteria bacterium]|nr:hypothetical protein [Pseudomonadota bacterium]
MMTSDLLKEIANSIAGDKTLQDWCKTVFDKKPTCYLGIDEENPPDPDGYPVIAIVGVTQIRSDLTRELSWDIELGIGVIDKTTTDEDQIKTYNGFLLAEDLREYTENAILRSRFARVTLTGEASSISYHPLYVSYSTINVKIKRSSQNSLP